MLKLGLCNYIDVYIHVNELIRTWNTEKAAVKIIETKKYYLKVMLHLMIAWAKWRTLKILM